MKGKEFLAGIVLVSALGWCPRWPGQDDSTKTVSNYKLSQIQWEFSENSGPHFIE